MQACRNCHLFSYNSILMSDCMLLEYKLHKMNTQFIQVLSQSELLIIYHDLFMMIHSILSSVFSLKNRHIKITIEYF